MSPSAIRRMWCAAMISTAVVGVLSGCQGTSEGNADSTKSAQSAHAQKTKQVEQESERLRKERDRLRAELSTAGKKATKSPAPKASAKTSGPPRSTSGSTSLRVSFDKLANRLGGSEAVAYAAVGGKATAQLGSWRAGPGWSTVKVPLAMAVIAKADGHPDAGTKGLLRQAITASDNAAAERLWASLGAPRVAASRVQAVLRSSGDGDTRVQSQRVRAAFTAFGQTSWSLTRQATFVAALPCLQYSGEVLALMGDVEPGQRWGIGAAGRPAQFKGGWGPGPGGGYLVRQMGIITLSNGSRVGLAIASEPSDGRFETGTANLTALARWAVANVRTKGTGVC